MNLLYLTLCLCACQHVRSLNLNEIKKMKTETTKLTTPTTTPTTTTTTPTTTTTTPTTTTTTPTTTTTVTTTITLPAGFSVVDPGPIMIECPDACESGWLYYDSSCYKKFNTALTFYDASNACMTAGAQLVKISSFEENEALRKAFDTNSIVAESQETWIGLNNVYSGFSWTDFTGLVYTNWAPTQPACPDEYCTGTCGQMITDALANSTYKYQRGGWKTYDCSKTSASYICEKAAAF